MPIVPHGETPDPGDVYRHAAELRLSVPRSAASRTGTLSRFGFTWRAARRLQRVNQFAQSIPGFSVPKFSGRDVDGAIMAAIATRGTGYLVSRLGRTPCFPATG